LVFFFVLALEASVVALHYMNEWLILFLDHFVVYLIHIALDVDIPCMLVCHCFQNGLVFITSLAASGERLMQT
jgi:hypothetical protein